MTEKDKTAALAKVRKLTEAARELHTKFGDLLEEIDAVVGGGAGIGADMKQFEQDFDAAWCARYAPGKTYIWTHVKDKPQIKRLLKMLGREELTARALAFLASEEPFYVKARHNFGVFVSSINSHKGLQRGTELALEAPVADCRHTPACRSDQEHTRRRGAEMRA